MVKSKLNVILKEKAKESSGIESSTPILSSQKTFSQQIPTKIHSRESLTRQLTVKMNNAKCTNIESNFLMNILKPGSQKVEYDLKSDFTFNSDKS